MFLRCLVDCKLQAFDNFQIDKLPFYTKVFRANFKWKIAALTWAVIARKQTSALEKLEGQARRYCEMNKGNSSFVCYCWSPETTTADYQRHPQLKESQRRNGLFFPFEVCHIFMVRGLREEGKDLFRCSANLQELFIFILISVLCICNFVGFFPREWPEAGGSLRLPLGALVVPSWRERSFPQQKACRGCPEKQGRCSRVLPVEMFFF